MPNKPNTKTAERKKDNSFLYFHKTTSVFYLITYSLSFFNHTKRKAALHFAKPLCIYAFLKTVLKVVTPFSEEAEIVPLWLSAIFFAIASPSP